MSINMFGSCGARAPRLFLFEIKNEIGVDANSILHLKKKKARRERAARAPRLFLFQIVAPLLRGPCEKMSLGSRSQIEMASDVQVMPPIWDNHLNAVSRDNAPTCVGLHIFPWSYKFLNRFAAAKCFAKVLSAFSCH